MKLIRFSLPDRNEVRGGILDGTTVRAFAGDLFGDKSPTGEVYPLADVRLHAPLKPGNIIGIGKNFVAEGQVKPPVPDLPIFFMKPLSTVIGPDEPILLPPGVAEVKFESELAVIIGRTASRIRPDQAEEVIFGYTVANDLAALQFFHPEGHWTVGKSFDTFCPLGPVIETNFDYRSARIQAAVNGVMKQDSLMERIIMPVDQMIAYISTFTTLQPGDVILTGTPAGADMVRDGDAVACTIEGIGSLSNPVQAIR
ncbi:DUF2437 domain-containing protein [Xylanibacillus composti]|uniref:2-keto-4-pentenoate hydratase/2-oxohepta-3-ene-1,7-dioic acid hydratase in catechol pathway n=1 Tax=Xylanibacillus composti TaxID=1572762 RepID=A0A8J4H2L5_9BACL|nr:fumarylacetoacetate hydrolase family protein [Xylanibacillus composti]MDT9724530.1 DUF2437 domain-containing protein [Xylanibacillus composti]GIQ69793.1 hypothetical protein XYCOK13_26170 [Xylanibacillus composti]